MICAPSYLRSGIVSSKLLLGFCFLLAVGFTTAQSLPPEIGDTLEPEEFVPDFSYAGYGFGTKPIPAFEGVTLDVTDFGAVPDDAIDDTEAVQEALAKARELPEAVRVRFPAGRFVLNEILELNRSDLLLSGAGGGEGGTTLYFSRPLNMVGDAGKLDELRTYLERYDKRQREPKRNLDVLFSEYSWTGGFVWVGRSGHRAFPYLEELDEPIPAITKSVSGSRGELTITVDDGSGLSTGQRIQILWYNREGAEGPLLKEIYGETELEIGSHHWSFPDRPLVRQRTQVLEVSGNQVRIADPLLHNISESVPVELAAWTPLERVGIEDLRFEFPDSHFFGHHVEQGYNAIYLTDLVDGWVRDVRFLNADSGILTYDSANLTLRDIQSLGDREAHYAVHMGSVHNVLAERVQVFNPVIHSLTFNTQSTRCVYKDAQVFAAAVLDQHAGSNHQNLYDNVTLHLSAEKKDGDWIYPVYDGSGAGYWQPGHGRFSTTWNLRVLVEGGIGREETVILQGLAEGPDARVFGISGNREFELDYYPAPLLRALNQRLESTPSLYEFQLQTRLAEGES
ncbi:glycosyl hydrolase family 28-related protein [Pelagicoccus albus]|uniref:Rhamnogalacturonase A/B/Epimerase-like pectate lyase domain-containing protein n=1 Tax=Pelagicoccus albus TaxID=415222 RepID=A0A7X1B6R9_9BACT|nr:glycosyl hydrolase family 28-related protein [Pelagicoccus albus]MBC2606719.1 hypothetical protein [Pelagicoccus albus]